MDTTLGTYFDKKVGRTQSVVICCVILVAIMGGILKVVLDDIGRHDSCPITRSAAKVSGQGGSVLAPALMDLNRRPRSKSKAALFMNVFFPDTNVLIEFGRDLSVRTKLENASRNGCKFVIAPPTLGELTRGVIGRGAGHLDQDKQAFLWLKAQACTILPLPWPFVGRVLGIPLKFGKVEPPHYEQLIEMIASSETFDDFLQQKDKADSSWSDIHRSDSIHHERADREFDALEKIAKSPSTCDLAARFCERILQQAGVHPDPSSFRQHFSAALEYLEASAARIRGGAKLKKNDRGRYGDWQLFFYLADPGLSFLTKEDFSHDIRNSPQRARIVDIRLHDLGIHSGLGPSVAGDKLEVKPTL